MAKYIEVWVFKGNPSEWCLFIGTPTEEGDGQLPPYTDYETRKACVHAARKKGYIPWEYLTAYNGGESDSESVRYL